MTTIKLFVDLVFVFTLTNLTARLTGDLTWTVDAQAALTFVVLFWMYGGYAWLTNEVPPVTTLRRLLPFGGMAAFLVCAVAVPGVFHTKALPFALGYSLVVVIHTVLYHEVAGTDAMRLACSTSWARQP